MTCNAVAFYDKISYKIPAYLFAVQALQKVDFHLPTVAKCPLLNAIRAAGTYLSNGPGNTGTACTGSGSSAPRARTRIWGAGTWLMLCNPSSAISQTVLHSQEMWQRLLRASGLKGQSTVDHWW